MDQPTTTRPEKGAHAEAFQDRIEIRTWDDRSGEIGGVTLEPSEALALVREIVEAYGEAVSYWANRGL